MFFDTFWNHFGLPGGPWGCQKGEKKGAKLVFFRGPPLGYHVGVILGGILVDLGRFLVPFGEASERYFGNVFLCLLLPCRGHFTTFWEGISSLVFLWLPCVLLPSWCSLLFFVIPCFPFPRVRARGAIEWCSFAFPVFVCVLVFPLPV